MNNPATSLTVEKSKKMGQETMHNLYIYIYMYIISTGKKQLNDGAN